jgi:hypothetical protein
VAIAAVGSDPRTEASVDGPILGSLPVGKGAKRQGRKGTSWIFEANSYMASKVVRHEVAMGEWSQDLGECPCRFPNPACLPGNGDVPSQG